MGGHFPLNSLDLENQMWGRFSGAKRAATRNPRPGCIVCDAEQTDLIFIHHDIQERPSLGREVHVGFPVCDDHDLTDLDPDQYVLNNLVVEVW